MKLYSTPLHFDRDKLDCIYMPASLCACLSMVVCMCQAGSVEVKTAWVAEFRRLLQKQSDGQRDNTDNNCDYDSDDNHP